MFIVTSFRVNAVCWKRFQIYPSIVREPNCVCVTKCCIYRRLLYPFFYPIHIYNLSPSIILIHTNNFHKMSLVTYARSIMDDDHVKRSSTYRVPVRECHRLVGFVKQWHCKRSVAKFGMQNRSQEYGKQVVWGWADAGLVDMHLLQTCGATTICATNEMCLWMIANSIILTLRKEYEMENIRKNDEWWIRRILKK